MNRRFFIATLSLALALGSTLQSNALAQEGRWQRMPGAAIAIASGGGELWCIGVDSAGGGGNGIFHWRSGNWHQSSGAAVRIAVDSNGVPWVVNAQHQIFRLRENGHWERLSGEALDIAAGGGAVWVIGTNAVSGGHGVWQWNGSSWTSISGGGVRIAVDGRGDPWLVNNAHQIWHYQPHRGTWRQMPGAATAIGANPGVWVTGTGSVGGGYEIFRWNAGSWQKYPGGAIGIAVGPGGNPWVVNDSNQIYRMI